MELFEQQVNLTGKKGDGWCSSCRAHTTWTQYCLRLPITTYEFTNLTEVKVVDVRYRTTHQWFCNTCSTTTCVTPKARRWWEFWR